MLGHLNVLMSQLSSAQNSLQTHEAGLRSLTLAPAPEFPVKEKEGLLTSLLRTRPLPETEAHEAECAVLGAQLMPSYKRLQPLLADALEMAASQQANHNWSGTSTRKDDDQATMDVDSGVIEGSDSGSHDSDSNIDDIDEVRKLRAEEETVVQESLFRALLFMRTGAR